MDKSGQMPDPRTLASTRSGPVLVYGAYGHTGRFVVMELDRRGIVPVLAGRSDAKLAALGGVHPELRLQVADTADPEDLDRALVGVKAVINCAGPFADTAWPLAEAALRSHVAYFDIAAEQPSTLRLFEGLGERAAAAGVTVMPAMGFFGALGDLLVTAAMGDWLDPDTIEVATALDSWEPTAGTLRTGRRNAEPYSEVRSGRLSVLDPSRFTEWEFPSPFGRQEVVPLPLAETALIFQHVSAPEVHASINRRSLEDLADSSVPRRVTGLIPSPTRQPFVVDVRVVKGNTIRRARAAGNDIYAVSAPIVVEATARLFTGLPAGVRAAGAVFNARDFLCALPIDLTLDLL